jgi:hypothetical protein
MELARADNVESTAVALFQVSESIGKVVVN